MLQNPLNLGLLTSFVLDPDKIWLVTGTAAGFFTLWDLRFNLPVKSWGLPSSNSSSNNNNNNSSNKHNNRIHRMIYHNSKPPPSFINDSNNLSADSSSSSSAYSNNNNSSYSNSAPWIFSTTGMTQEVSAWDIQTGECRQLLRVIPNATPENTPPIPNMRPLPVPQQMDYGIETLQVLYPFYLYYPIYLSLQ